MGGRRKGVSEEEARYNAEIAQHIEQLRRERNISSTHLAAAIGVTQQVLSSYEAGSVRWPAFRLRLIADYLMVPLDRIAPKKTRYCC